jgi:DNA-binding transcriptional LysR family regulator
MFNDLDLFFLVAEKGSFLKASKYSKYSHVTLQRRITALENQLGEKLFIRSATGLVKTDFANSLIADIKYNYDSLKMYFKRFELAKADSYSIYDKPIKLFFSSGMAYFFIETIYPLLIKKHKFKIEITTYTNKFMEFGIDQLKSLIQEYDVVFIEGDYEPIIADTRWLEIFRRQGVFRFYASEGYIEKYGEVDDLSKHNCLYLNLGFKDYIELYRSGSSKKEVIRVRGDFSSDTIEHILKLTLDSHGVGLLPDFYVNSALKSPLKHVKKEFHGREHQLNCFKNSLAKSEKIDSFVQELKEVVKGIN